MPPATGDVAQIRISSPGFKRALWVYISEDEDCKNKGALGFIGQIRSTTASDENTNIPGKENLFPETYFDKFIEAGKEVNISMNATGVGVVCEVGAIFKPEASAVYEVNFTLDHDGCYMEIDKLERSGSQFFRIKTDARKAKKVCSDAPI